VWRPILREAGLAEISLHRAGWIWKLWLMQIGSDDGHVCRPGWCRELTNEFEEPVWWHETPAGSYATIGGVSGTETYSAEDPMLLAYLTARGLDWT
jgi:hypothetical protein